MSSGVVFFRDHRRTQRLPFESKIWLGFNEKALYLRPIFFFCPSVSLEPSRITHRKLIAGCSPSWGSDKTEGGFLSTVSISVSFPISLSLIFKLKKSLACSLDRLEHV